MLYKLLSCSHKNSDFQHSVISLTDSGVYGRQLEEMGIPVSCLRLVKDRLAFFRVFKLYGLLAERRPHVLQTWLYHADFLGLVFGRLLPGSTKIAWNIRCSYMDFKHFSPVSRLMYRLLAFLSHMPDAVVVNSQAGQLSHSKGGYRPRRWENIPNGFDTDRFKPDHEIRKSVRQSLGLDASSIAIGMIARHDPMKDHHTFFSAAENLSHVFPDARFILAGRGMTEDNKKIDHLIQKSGLEKKTILLGEREDISHILQAFDINTLCSLGEGFPNVLGESMAAGIPCVATDVGDAANIIGDTGRVVPVRDSEALVHSWRQLLSLPREKRSALGLKARKRILDNFSISKISRIYENFYAELLRGQ